MSDDTRDARSHPAACGRCGRPEGVLRGRRFRVVRPSEGRTTRNLRPLVRARWAVSSIFFLNGVVPASWVPHIPAVKQAHGIGDAELGAVLLCMAAGAVCALSVAGRVVRRYGSRSAVVVAAAGLCVALPLPIVSPTVPMLAVSLLLLGASNGMLDVSENSQAVLVEQRYGRPIMSSFHGLFGVGGLVGAGAAGVLMYLGVSSTQHVVATALAGLVLTNVARRALVVEPAPSSGPPPAFVRPTGIPSPIGSVVSSATTPISGGPARIGMTLAMPRPTTRRPFVYRPPAWRPA